jgi:hypothetical protein
MISADDPKQPAEPTAPRKTESLVRRSLLGRSEATRFDKACALFGGVFFAPVILYISVKMISDLPDRSELMGLQSSDVVDVEFRTSSGSLSGIRLYDSQGLRLTVSSREDGFEQLVHAIRVDRPYSVYYAKERELFSSSSKLYNVIYEIRAGNEIVKSYDKRVNSIRALFGAIGVFGVLWLVGAILVLRAPTKAAPPSPMKK